MTALALAAGALVAAEAAAEIEVHVRNCTDSKLKVEVYDAKDSAETIPASQKTFDANSRGQTHLFRCHGEGRGYCKAIIYTRGGPDSDRCIEEWGGEATDHVHIESGHRVDVIGFEGTEDGCRPVVEVENTTADCNYVYD